MHSTTALPPTNATSEDSSLSRGEKQVVTPGAGDANEPQPWALSPKRTIPLDFLPDVQARIAAVNRRAARLQCAPFVLTVGPVYAVPDRRFRDSLEPSGFRPMEVVDVEISGERIEVAGFRFLGRIDFEGGATLVNARPGETIPAHYRTTTPRCEHCNSDRRRTAVFLFRRNDDDTHIQVGRQCLADFMGHDPARVLHSVSLWAELCGDLDDAEGGYGGRTPDTVGVDATLATAAAVIRSQNGRFVSRSAADQTGTPPTSADVFEQLFPPRPAPESFKRLDITADDIARAAAAKAWALETMAHADASDYEYNMIQLLQSYTVRSRRIGLLVSLLGVYARHLGELQARAKRVDAFVGTTGERRRFAATYSGCTTIDTAYGTLYIGRFDTTDGLLVYRGSSPFWPETLAEGAGLEFTATIKEHDTYKGNKQTVVQRAKVHPVAA